MIRQFLYWLSAKCWESAVRLEPNLTPRERMELTTGLRHGDKNDPPPVICRFGRVYILQSDSPTETHTLPICHSILIKDFEKWRNTSAEYEAYWSESEQPNLQSVYNRGAKEAFERCIEAMKKHK